jgi:hypothetical protein
MTSSLASAFEFSGRRAVCIAADKVTVYHWGHGGLSDSFAFDADDTGLAFFTRYMEESPDTPVYLLVDAIEEEFRTETMPHVRGADRRAILQRRLARAFRNTPYVYSEVQGRETDARRDDRILLAALTNPGLLAPWLEVFERVKVPVAGVYSVPLLSRLLLPSVKGTEGQFLLLTVQAASGLRQSCFVDGQLRASRLAKLPRIHPQDATGSILAELERFRRYLLSVGAIVGDRPLTVCVLSHGQLLTQLSTRMQDSELTTYRLVDVARVAAALKVSGVLTSPHSDVLYAHLLLARRPANHYGTGNDTRYYHLHRVRIGMYSVAIACLATGLLVAGFLGIQGLHLGREAENIRERTAFYAERLRVERGRLPPTLVEPFEVERAVEAVREIETHRITPAAALATLGGVLAGEPALRLTDLVWDLDRNPPAPATGPPASMAGLAPAPDGAAAEGSLPGLQQEVPGPWLLYQSLDVRGEISGFSGDYRAALATVESLARRLAAREDVWRVDVLERPLDATPGAVIAGRADGLADAGTGVRAPGFRLRLVQAVR